MIFNNAKPFICVHIFHVQFTFYWATKENKFSFKCPIFLPTGVKCCHWHKHNRNLAYESIQQILVSQHNKNTWLQWLHKFARYISYQFYWSSASYFLCVCHVFVPISETSYFRSNQYMTYNRLPSIVQENILIEVDDTIVQQTKTKKK
mgnify:CR=1 FL=1